MSSIFRIPPALKALFDSFPLLTLPPTPLPFGCPTLDPQQPSLWIFTTPEDAAQGKPSFNPTCLLWQTYLKLCGVEVKYVPANKHAERTGELPFLTLPAGSAGAGQAAVVRDDLRVWVRKNVKEPESTRDEKTGAGVFMALLGRAVRNAWLYAFYLEPHNFTTLCTPRYSTTSVALVNTLVTSRLQSSVREKLLVSYPGGVISADDIYADARNAWSALSTMLGGDKWFFGAQEPGYFDAALFGFTHLILTLRWDEREAELVRGVRKWANLVEHEGCMRMKVFPNLVL